MDVTVSVVDLDSALAAMQFNFYTRIVLCEFAADEPHDIPSCDHEALHI